MWKKLLRLSVPLTAIAILLVDCGVNPARNSLPKDLSDSPLEIVQSEALDGTVKIVRAYAEGNEICFDPIAPLDWGAIASRSFHRFPLKQPNRQDVRKNWREITSRATFDFSAGLPKEAAEWIYVVLSEDGIRRLWPRRLAGEVSYGADAEATRISAPLFSGRVCGMVGKRVRVDDAGFILASRREEMWKTKAVAWRRSERGEYSVRIQGREFRVPPLEAGSKDLRKAYIVTRGSAGKAYLFVRWEPDPGCSALCCEFSYTFFEIGDDLREILWNAYGCDV
ncbi:MAG: hypothetical protein ACREEM_05730 [Blastocatellia bacterium]